MNPVTTRVVKARDLRQNDQIIILDLACTVIDITITGKDVTVKAESNDAIGSIMMEGVYQPDQPITVYVSTD